MRDVTPFVIGSARQFNPEPPPALTSQRYADDFNEVKALGGVTSATRTADQTLVARLFAVIPSVTTTGIPGVWNNLTRDLIRSRNLNDIEAARLYALINTAFHDSLFALVQRQVSVWLLEAGHGDPGSRARRQSGNRAGPGVPRADSDPSLPHVSGQLRVSWRRDDACLCALLRT